MPSDECKRRYDAIADVSSRSTEEKLVGGGIDRTFRTERLVSQSSRITYLSDIDIEGRMEERIER